MKAQEIEKLKELCEKATPGPWKLFCASSVTAVECNEKVPVVSWGGFDNSDRKIGYHRANAAFISAARTAVPELIKEIEVYRSRIGQLELALLEYQGII